MIKRILSIALSLMLLCLPCAMAEGGSASTLTVIGNATVSLPADAAMIILGVRETAEDVGPAQDTVNQKIAAIRTALTEMGIDNTDIVTESLYIYANYDYSTAITEITSYTANNSLRITVRDIDMTAGVIDAAFAAGANTLDEVSFYATDISAASDQAYAEAVANAMHKAEIIAQAAGRQNLSILDITEGVTYQWIDNGMKLRATAYATEDAAAGADIQQSNVTVTANVTITYLLGE